MNIIKQKKIKSKISKLSAHNISIIYIYIIFSIIQNISIPTRKAFLSSTVNNTNNNSTSSINLNSNLKTKQKKMKNNSLYNQKIGSIKKKAQIQFFLGNKINLYKKKIFNQKNINSIGIPNESSSLNTTSQYIKYKHLKPNNNQSEKIIINKTNSNLFINSTASNNSNISFNKNNKNLRKNIINNNNHRKSSKIKSVNTNNYIINTLNFSEKNYINKSALTNKIIQKNINEEINKCKKEKDELKKIYQKHERLIEKLTEDNKSLSDKIGGMKHENNKLKQKINVFKENQEQLVMLVKIIQQNGIDIEDLIDKWNDEIENEEEFTSKGKIEELTSNSNVIDSINELNGKIDCTSFIPITFQEKKTEKKIKVSGVPKLNLAPYTQ